MSLSKATDVPSALNSLGWAQSRTIIPRVVATTLGLWLLTTALLKVQGLSGGTLGQSLVWFTPSVQLAAVEIEVVLGLWLLSGWARRAAWLVSLTFFLVLAGVSFYLGWIGQSSCGCFGRIRVSPWGAFALDGACLAALVLGRPSLDPGGMMPLRRWGRELLRFSVVPAVLGAVGLGVVLWTGEPPQTLLARWRGERLVVEPAISDVGTAVAGERQTFHVQIRNHSRRRVTLIGGTADCACVATDDLPVTIEPGGAVTVAVHIVFRGTAGRFQQQFVFYTDDADQKQVLARFHGAISAAPAP